MSRKRQRTEKWSRDKSSLPHQDIPRLMCHPDRVIPITITTSNQLAKESGQAQQADDVTSSEPRKRHPSQSHQLWQQGCVSGITLKTGPFLTEFLPFPRPSPLPQPERLAPFNPPSHHPSGPSLPDYSGKTICHGLTPGECVLALGSPAVPPLSCTGLRKLQNL